MKKRYMRLKFRKIRFRTHRKTKGIHEIFGHTHHYDVIIEDRLDLIYHYVNLCFGIVFKGLENEINIIMV